MKPWRYIQDQQFIERAREAIRAVLSDLGGLFVDNASLLFGQAGLALFYHQAALVNSGEGLNDKAAESIELAYSLLDELPQASLYHGFVGVAFVLQHLKNIFEVPEESLQELDQMVLAHLASWSGEYELLVGLVGVGVYALERSPSPEASQMLDLVLRSLEAASTTTSTGITWLTRPEHAGPDFPEGNYNLGMAHGLPGVISFLTRLTPHQKYEAIAKRLLQGAVSELLSKETPAGFPGFILPDGSYRRLAPPAWAYGDAGIAMSLWFASEATQSEAWRREALRIAYRAARTEPSATPSAALCQGKAGAGHIFLRLYQYTNDDIFYEAAQRWLTAVLDSRAPGRGVGGFHSLVLQRFHALDEVGFLTGSVGIAMSLLAAISPESPGWDRLLLLS